MSSDQGCDIHFLKKIEEYTLRIGELRIPRSFVNKCWEGISNPVLLLLPNGDEWKVKWKNLDADVWLIDDWKKFAEFYCLDQDHQLVFKYVGKSQFQVVIFDQSGLEMVCPSMEGASDGEGSGHCVRQSKRAQFLLPSSPSTKKVKTNPRKEPSCYPNEDMETSRGRRRIIYANKRCSKFEAKTTQSEGQSALERAKAFRSDNPFLIREMKPSYIRLLLAMPGNFVKEQYRKEGTSVAIRTSDSGDKTWLAKLSVNCCSGQIMLTAGWRNFVKENSLKIGDACVFEQIKSPTFSLRVHIFRDGEGTNPTMFPEHSIGIDGRK